MVGRRRVARAELECCAYDGEPNEAPPLRKRGGRIEGASLARADRMDVAGTSLAGVRVLVASERDAYDVLQQEGPDVLVSDLSMPGEDGFWLIAAIRALSAAHGGGTPAAALTGHVTPEDRASVLRAGFQFHVAKPDAPDHLVGIVAILAQKP